MPVGGDGEVLVVGGGIGGLAAALCLARAGAEVRVLERSSEFVEVGAGIQLAPNATRLLACWGLLERITAAGVRPRRLVIRSAVSGDELGWLDPGEAFCERYGAPYVVCHRNDLLAALLAACREMAAVALEVDREVVEASVGEDSVEVVCADGSSYRGAGLVGADGLRSRIRSLVAEDEPICAGFASYRGAIPLADATRPAALDEVVVWIGPGQHFVQYALHEGDLYNQVAVFRSAEYAAGVEDWGSPGELDRAFAGSYPEIREALKSIRRDARWYMYDREPLDRWSAGRLTLLGDAAHPMLQYLAQGACQALEDAGALGDAVAERTSRGRLDGLPGAFLAYEAARSAQAARVQRGARLWGDIWHTSDPVAVLLRDTIMRSNRPDDFHHTDWLYHPVGAC